MHRLWNELAPKIEEEKQHTLYGGYGDVFIINNKQKYINDKAPSRFLTNLKAIYRKNKVKENQKLFS